MSAASAAETVPNIAAANKSLRIERSIELELSLVIMAR
ncbi:hypothetical protein ACVWWR_001841 [Bradyrhizobium sp. LM3.2]